MNSCPSSIPSSFTDHRRRGLLRGLAFVEGILVLSIFAVLWAGVRHLGRLSNEGLATASEARRCAWAVSLGGCQTVPPECRARSSAPPASRKLDHLEEVAASQPSPDSGVDASIERSVAPLLRGLLGQRTRASASREVTRERTFGGGTTNVERGHVLPCAPRGEDAPDVAEDVFGALLGGE